MTWEDKLFRLLATPKKEFNTDSKIGGFLDKNIIISAKAIEKAIAEGNCSIIDSLLIEFTELYNHWKLIISHLKKTPKCVDYTKGSNNWKWERGIFQLGYNQYPKGIQQVIDSQLYYSRLIRDAKIRCLKHPRNKKE